MGKPKTYFLQNGYSGNSMLFWAKGGCGYTSDIDNAEEFSRADAISQIRSSWDSHYFKMWDADVIKTNATRYANSEKIPTSAGYRPKSRPSLKGGGNVAGR